MLKQKLLAITLSSLILSTTSLGFAQIHQPAPSAQFVTTAKPTVWAVAASKKAQSLNTLNLSSSQELDDTVLTNTNGQILPLIAIGILGGSLISAACYFWCPD